MGGPVGDDQGLLSLLTPGAPVLVTGAGVTGRAVLAVLEPLQVAATLCDDNAEALRALAEQGTAVIDPASAIAGISDYALVVTSPGFPPTAPVLAADTTVATGGPVTTAVVEATDAVVVVTASAVVVAASIEVVVLRAPPAVDVDEQPAARPATAMTRKAIRRFTAPPPWSAAMRPAGSPSVARRWVSSGR